MIILTIAHYIIDTVVQIFDTVVFNVIDDNGNYDADNQNITIGSNKRVRPILVLYHSSGLDQYRTSLYMMFQQLLSYIMFYARSNLRR